MNSTQWEMLGFLAGQKLRDMRKVQKEPVAYSYNGLLLPKLPEWDREKYPYVFIALPWLTSLGYNAVASQEPACVNNRTIDYEYPWLELEYSEESGWGKWREMAEGAESDLVPHYSKQAWANYDLLKADGSVWLAASDPIPVYE